MSVEEPVSVAPLDGLNGGSVDDSDDVVSTSDVDGSSVGDSARDTDGEDDVEQTTPHGQPRVGGPLRSRHVKLRCVRMAAGGTSSDQQGQQHSLRELYAAEHYNQFLLDVFNAFQSPVCPLPSTFFAFLWEPTVDMASSSSPSTASQYKQLTVDTYRLLVFDDVRADGDGRPIEGRGAKARSLVVTISSAVVTCQSETVPIPHPRSMIQLDDFTRKVFPRIMHSTELSLVGNDANGAPKDGTSDQADQADQPELSPQLVTYRAVTHLPAALYGQQVTRGAACTKALVSPFQGRASVQFVCLLPW